jgi:hypothetical protein
VWRYFKRYQLAAWLTPWFLSGAVLALLALAAVNTLSISYAPVTALFGFCSTLGVLTLLLWLRKNTTLLKNHFTLHYIVLQLIAWLTGFMTLAVIAVLSAPSGFSSIVILGVLPVVSYALTYTARLKGDRWLRLVSFGVLLLTLGRVLSVEAWRLPDSLVLVPFLLTGIALISLTMKLKHSAL